MRFGVAIVGFRIAAVTMAFIHVRSISHLVQDRFGVSPQPRNWPKQSAKNKGEQTNALNRLGLRMLFLLRNFFRQDMHHPENSDANNRRDNEHNPRNAIRDRVERFSVEQ